MEQFDNTGKTLVTAHLQKLLNEFAGQELTLPQGTYLTGPLFVRSGTTLHLQGVTLRATTDEAVWPLVPTRVAGIEMDWYPAVLNVQHAEGVTIIGGTIEGQGPYWWNKYWGKDTHGGMRELYDRIGLRWACDYDCCRPRNLLITQSHNVTVKDLTSRESGFWNVHVLYSEEVLLDGITVDSHGGCSPSTDGIDVDSSHHVTVQNCSLHCNDDSIAIKSGRDSDGLRVNVPSHDILIQNCDIYAGYGITIGSECSGGVYGVTVQNVRYHGTDCGFRIKSAYPRKGYIKDVLLKDLVMTDVKFCFHLYLNWNPDYNVCTIPASYEGDITPHYRALTTPVSSKLKPTSVQGITVEGLTATLSPDMIGESQIFHIVGYPESPMQDLHFKNCHITAHQYGKIQNVKNVIFENFTFDAVSEQADEGDKFDNR